MNFYKIDYNNSNTFYFLNKKYSKKKIIEIIKNDLKQNENFILYNNKNQIIYAGGAIKRNRNDNSPKTPDKKTKINNCPNTEPYNCNTPYQNKKNNSCPNTEPYSVNNNCPPTEPYKVNNNHVYLTNNHLNQIQIELQKEFNKMNH